MEPDLRDKLIQEVNFLLLSLFGCFQHYFGMVRSCAFHLGEEEIDQACEVSEDVASLTLMT